MSGYLDDRLLYLPSPNSDQEVRLHLDENISGAIARLLRKQGFDVTTTNDVGLRAQSDVSHMSFAREHQRIIVTRDRDFLKLHAADHQHSGIVYWPHSEEETGRDMQERLVQLLHRILESPAQQVEVPTDGKQIRLRRRARKRRTQDAATGVAANWLPTGLLVEGIVVAERGRTIEVELDSGEQAVLKPNRRPPGRLVMGESIRAVTVRYVRSKKQLHVSMRRNFSLARSVTPLGIKLLRRSGHAKVLEVQTRWPVEVVREGDSTLRIYGLTADAVRQAEKYLGEQIPWMASAILRLDARALDTWCRTAFGGGLSELAQITGTMIRVDQPDTLQVLATSNRELDCLVRRIQARVPDLQVDQFQAARSEALMPCRWEQLVRSDSNGRITIRAT